MRRGTTIRSALVCALSLTALARSREAGNATGPNGAQVPTTFLGIATTAATLLLAVQRIQR